MAGLVHPELPQHTPDLALRLLTAVDLGAVPEAAGGCARPSIVLANTDLLSRSYQAGHGDANDVLSSLVVVTFYKRFVLAAHYDQPLPVIDWSGDYSTVLDLIRQVPDEEVQDLLNKEFQARRALASSLVDLKASIERLASMRTTAEG